tara:strand:- start:497 stop:1111 length:615 start_codon:yes stop_codon:yes gene_type:complete
MAIDKIPKIFKILQAMRPYIKSGEMTLDNALKYFQEKGIEMTGVARRAVENAFKKTKGTKDEVFDDTVQKLPYDEEGIPFNPRRPQKDYGSTIRSMMDDDQYFNFKEDYFGRIIANTDEAVKDLATRIIKGEQDVQFNRLSPAQKKDFLNMVDDRMLLGNKEFMMTYTNDAGNFANPTNINRTKQAAGGRVQMAKGGLPNVLGF